MALEIRTTTAKPSRARDENFVDVYANQLRLNLSIVDFNVIFGKTDDQGPGNVVIKDLVSVRLSLAGLKMLYKNLETAVEAYEAVFGKIQTGNAVQDENLASMRRQLMNSLQAQAQGGQTTPPA